ncbi:MAG: septum formation protein Maf [Oscillospiraceae bacterium]|nr:septum formation protein Maf [Oscillospiraceae bacterium]
MQVILASASPRRRELLRFLFDSFEIIPADVDEESIAVGAEGGQTASLLAAAKADAVAAAHPDALVIGCDTVVEAGGILLGKPRDREDARRMLQLLSSGPHRVITGVALRLDGQKADFSEVTQISFRPLSEEEIEAYIATPEPYDKAGGYGIQEGATRFVSEMEGDFFNVVGLPVTKLYQTLLERFPQAL